jgi:hypothetical protein
MMVKKKEGVSHWLMTVANIFSGVFETIVHHSNEQIKELKKKVLHYVVIYGMFTMAVFFLIIGMIKYLAESYILPSEGISFIVVGSVIIVLLAAYSLIKDI